MKRQGKKYVEGFSLDVGPLKHMLRVSRSDRDIEQRLLKLTHKVSKLVSAVRRKDGALNPDASLAEHHRGHLYPQGSCLTKIRKALVNIRNRD